MVILSRFIRFLQVCFYMHTTQRASACDYQFRPNTGFRASVYHLMLRGFLIGMVFSSDSFLRHFEKAAGLSVILRGEERE